MAINVPPEERGPVRRSCIYPMILALIMVVLAIIVLVSIFAAKETQFYAAIDTVSGLDLATRNLSTPALDQVEFNLILGIKSRRPFSSDCFEPGATIEVTYLGARIANGSTSAQACAAGWKPEQMVRMPVVARGTGAQLPASVLPGLAANVTQGLALFDVSLRIPATPGDDGKLVMCRGRRVGGGAVGALLVPCDEPQKVHDLVVYAN